MVDSAVRSLSQKIHFRAPVVSHFCESIMSAASTSIDSGNLENCSVSELVSILRTAFRTVDFDKVEEVLVAKEVKLKREIENKNKECQLLQDKYAFLRLDKITHESELQQFKLDFNEFQKLKETSEKLKEKEEEILVLKQLVVNVNEDRLAAYEKEKKAVERYEKLLEEIKKTDQDNQKIMEELNCKNSELERAKRAVELDLELCKKKYEELGHRVSHLEVVSDRIQNPKGKQEYGRKIASGGLLEIIDSDDDHAPMENFSEAHGTVKRKRYLVLDDLEDNKAERNDEEFPILLGEIKAEKIGALLDTVQNSCRAKLGFKSSFSSGTNDSKKVITSSRTAAVMLRQCEEKVGAECKSRNSNIKSATFCKEYSLKDRSIYSESDANKRNGYGCSHLMPKGQGSSGNKKWETEAEMRAAFEEEDELCMEAVCVLYRQSKSHLSSRPRGFNKADELRGLALALFLTNKDPQGKMNRSAMELKNFDIKGLSDCRRIVIQHSSQLFQIYKNKEDRFFLF